MAFARPRSIGCTSLFLLFCACSEEGLTPGSDARDQILETACERRLAPECSPTELDRDECASIHSLDGPARAVNEGRARIDEEALDRCLAELGCAGIPEACFRTFVGRGEVGEGCGAHVDCQPGLFCDGMGDCGRCAPEHEVVSSRGEVCTNDLQCPLEGLESDETSTCVRESFFEPGVCGGRVVRPGEIGESCADVLEGSTRQVRIACPEGSVCLPQESGDRICVTAASSASLGESCLWGPDMCEAGLLCAAGRCVREALEGEACDEWDAEDPIGCRRESGVVCLSGECTPTPDEPGDACNIFGSCRNGLHCITGICVEERANHELCFLPEHCLSGYCGPAGVCADAVSCH